MKLPISRNENIVVQEANKEILIYDLVSNQAFCLNKTSAMIWSLCNGKNSVKQISRILSQKLNEPITEDLIWLAIDQFKRDGLLKDEQFEINFNGLTRRQVIRRIGLTSMIAFPVISSVIAPSAAQAASGGTVALFGSCNTSSECMSGNCVAQSLPGNICCVPGSTFHSSVGVGSCSNSQAACDSRGLTGCCNGAAPVIPSAFCVAVTGQPFECVCNQV